jgi:hypothetical protein
MFLTPETQLLQDSNETTDDNIAVPSGAFNMEGPINCVSL